jgi:nucleotide-binding universal stress UspA family protein
LLFAADIRSCGRQSAEALNGMISIERILCPASLPPESDEALGFAVSLAHAFKAALFVCHCAGKPSLITIGAAPPPSGGQVRKMLADSFARYLGRADDSRALRWKVVVESGKDVGEEIVREARALRTDLIVMRSRRSRVAALLGSTAEHVSRTAACPVLVIRPPEQCRTPNCSNVKPRFSRVLVSHDFSSGSELALSYALSIAQKYRADLHLIHVLPEVVEDEPELAWVQPGVESAYHRAARRLQNSVPEEVYRWSKVTNAVRWGKPYREVLAYSRQNNIDLICMGAQGRDFGLEALFGSNVDRVLRQATCSVLIARPLRPATHAPLNLNIKAAY